MQNVFVHTCKYSLYKPTTTSKLPRLKKKKKKRNERKSAFQIQPRNPEMKQRWGGGLPIKLFIGLLGGDNYYLAACSEIPLLGRNMCTEKQKLKGILEDGGLVEFVTMATCSNAFLFLNLFLKSVCIRCFGNFNPIHSFMYAHIHLSPELP